MTTSLRECVENAVAQLEAVPAWRRWHGLRDVELAGPAHLPADLIREVTGLDPDALAVELGLAGLKVGKVMLVDGCGGLVWGHTMVAMSEAELALMDEIERHTGKLLPEPTYHTETRTGRRGP